MVDRPKCVHEANEFDNLLPQEYNDPAKFHDRSVHLGRTTALFQILLDRAAAALTINPFIEYQLSSKDEHTVKGTQLSAAFNAFLRISREHLRYSKEFAEALKNKKCTDDTPDHTREIEKSECNGDQPQTDRRYPC